MYHGWPILNSFTPNFRGDTLMAWRHFEKVWWWSSSKIPPKLKAIFLSPLLLTPSSIKSKTVCILCSLVCHQRCRNLLLLLSMIISNFLTCLVDDEQKLLPLCNLRLLQIFLGLSSTWFDFLQGKKNRFFIFWKKREIILILGWWSFQKINKIF